VAASVKDGSTTRKESPAEREEFHELCYYTLAHPDPSFIHQHVVDAFTAQTADENTKPIALAFALIGLYLYIEAGYSGKEVQRMHMKLGRRRRPWKTFHRPEEQGNVRVSDVLAAPPGPGRDAAIREWCTAVWEAYKESRPAIIDLIGDELGRLPRR
jgi:hypothetical protein